jgi:hypothetical protein
MNQLLQRDTYLDIIRVSNETHQDPLNERAKEITRLLWFKSIGNIDTYSMNLFDS